MKLFTNNPFSFSNKLKYTSAILALAVTSCGLNPNKPSLENKSIRVGKSDAPKVVMTCTLKQDSDDRFFVFKTSKNEYYLANAKDENDALDFNLLGDEFSYFSLSKGDFGSDVQVASVKKVHNDETGFLTLVSNSDARTLEVIRYKATSDKISAGAIPTKELTEDSDVLFSSKNCEAGRTGDKPEAVEENAADNDIRAENNESKAEGALERAKDGVKDVAEAAKDQAKELGKDVKEEISQWVVDPTPSKVAIESLREVINNSTK